MGFAPPLKVFLSYSHDDDPKLFREFRNQLTALEDDRLIKVWADRDNISAGRDWDREIKKGLNDCDILLALTSASFNASGYIRGVEMQTAWDRHHRVHILPAPAAANLLLGAEIMIDAKVVTIQVGGRRGLEPVVPIGINAVAKIGRRQVVVE